MIFHISVVFISLQIVDSNRSDKLKRRTKQNLCYIFMSINVIHNPGGRRESVYLK